jgi:hypothetical protein
VVAPSLDDGSMITTSVNAGGYYSHVIDMDALVKNENDLIRISLPGPFLRRIECVSSITKDILLFAPKTQSALEATENAIKITNKNIFIYILMYCAPLKSN